MVAQMVNVGDPGLIPQLGRSPGERNGNPLRILGWRILCTVKPGGLQSMGSHTVGHNLTTNHQQPSHDMQTQCSHGLCSLNFIF